MIKKSISPTKIINFPSINQNNIIDGDSIAEGTCYTGVVTYPSWMHGITSAWRNPVGTPAGYLEQYTGKFFINSAYSGDKTSDMIARWSTAVGTFNPAGIIILHIGVNDFGNGISLATIQANFEALFTLAAAASSKIAFVSVPYQESARISEILTLNSWLSSRCTTLGFLYIDYTAFALAHYTDATYYHDNYHLVALGYNHLINEVFKPALISKGWI